MKHIKVKNDEWRMKMKEERKKQPFINERREDEISKTSEASQNNTPTPNPKDYEDIEY